ncbi:hypothetical protein QCM80_11960 [Bradyrhizobium sp. SSUT112]|uniref:hypothetical protein n=1 Tax=Bradyrhizobium sp. SSUT112 TaxID=3040604 RepID=UPI00244D4C7D|nr:hypothetical protein [Bradyrhizobium sp. SSUT112]MDH2351378.1 hypothetical protein [Bradyrhizobium sp. SSUT112]
MLLVISLCAGLVITPFAHLGYDLLPFSAFLLTLGSFLTAGLAPSEASIRLPLLGLVLAWVGLALLWLLRFCCPLFRLILRCGPAFCSRFWRRRSEAPPRLRECSVCDQVSRYSFPSR